MAGSYPFVPLDAAAGLHEEERVEPNGWRWRAVMLRAPGAPALLYSPLLGPNHFHYLGIAAAPPWWTGCAR